MLIRERVTRFKNRVYRTKAGIWACEVVAPRHKNIIIVKREGDDPDPILMLAHNIVTDAGDVYYAQKAVGESPTNVFARLYLSTVDWDASHPAKASSSDNIASVISGSEKAVATNWPRTADPDSDNTGSGADVISWKFSYTKTDFNDPSIDAGAISKASVTSWGAGAGSDAVLTGFDLTAFEKTANDTLTVYVNHTQNGV